MGLLILTSCSVGYKNDGNEVTWHTWNEGNGHNSRKVDADPETFEVLDDDYGRDKTHAFYRGDIIKVRTVYLFECSKKAMPLMHLMYMIPESCLKGQTPPLSKFILMN